MGVDYRAKTVIGVPFEWDHFFEEYEEERVICNHPEAEGVRFCPVCGARHDQRVEKVKKTRVRKPFLMLSPFDRFSDPLDIDEDELHEFKSDTWGMKIGRAEVIDLGDYENHDYVLGVQIHRTDSSNGGREMYPSTEWERVKDKGDFAGDVLEGMGFDRSKMMCWTVLDCSY